MTMRLTLRTLLAYLDDTLEPTEIKQIGQKVAESDAAQELIARIKQVTRRRRLTTPPATGPGARFDANTVAEYLDNELATEPVAELEKTCLESDVHLAEIAACHQILTLVLGEPALVPPTAKERMYGLVRGREAIPFRKASSAAGAGGGAGEGESEADDTFLLGLPFYRKHGTLLRWALPLAGVFLLVGLGVALWLAMPRPKGPKVASADTKKIDKPADNPKPPDDGKKPKDANTKGPQPADTKSAKPGPTDTKEEGPEPKDTKGGEPKDGTGEESPPVRPAKEPSAARVLVGEYHGAPGGGPSVLVRRAAQGSGKGEGTFERVSLGSRVHSAEALISLPGYLSELRLKTGVNVLLRGNVPQFASSPEMLYLLESSVTPHKPAKGVDAELTLHRGRIHLVNRKREGAAVVRLRFGRDEALDRRPGARGEIWDLKLQEPDTEVALDFIKAYTRDIDYKNGEGPRFELYLCVLQGRISLKTGPFNDPEYLEAPPGKAFVLWDNKGRGAEGPYALEKVPAVWDKAPPRLKEPVPARAVEQMTKALRTLSKRTALKEPGQSLEAAVWEGLDKDLMSRLLAIYTLGALDDVRQLVGAEVLDNPEPAAASDRDAAVFTLRRWVSRNARQSQRLYDKATETGILIDTKQYRPRQASIIVELLHDFTDAERKSPETFQALAGYLASEKVAIAELAWYHLFLLARQGKVPLPAFNAAAPKEVREKYADHIRTMITDKKLPPPEPRGEGAPPTRTSP